MPRHRVLWKKVLEMSIGGILTLGLGSFTDVSKIVTLGYYVGAVPIPFYVDAAGYGGPLIVASHLQVRHQVNSPGIVASYMREVGEDSTPVIKT